MLSNLKLLVVNDDGVHAPGIYSLVKALYEYTHNITVLAPATQMSAVSHGRCFSHGFKFERLDPIYKDVLTYSLDGTPADCVRFAFDGLNEEYDLIVSGINNGFNLGDDILYSGTCGAAFEAVLIGAKALCFSSAIGGEEEASMYIKDAVKYITEHDLFKNHKLLNVNIPVPNKGIKETFQGFNEFATTFSLVDGLYYPGGYPKGPLVKQSEFADIQANTDGFISITPLTTDRTDHGK